MDGVLIYPTVTTNEPPSFGEDFTWQIGPLARLDESGMPAEPVVAKVSEELPSALQDSLDRLHIDLWDSPIQVGRIDVVGFEYVANDDETLAPAMLLVHFISNTGNLDVIANLRSTRTKVARDFLAKIAPGLVLHPLQSRGFAVVAQAGDPSFTVHDGVFLVESENPKLQSSLHGRLALSLQVAAAQFYSLQIGLLLWPSIDDSDATWDEFHQSMSLVSQKLVWPKISLNVDAQHLYEGIRTTLGIEASLNQVLADIDRRNQIVQAKSAQALNSYGLVFAVSGLTATWIGIGVATTSPIGTVGGLITFAAVAWIKFKNRRIF